MPLISGYLLVHGISLSSQTEKKIPEKRKKTIICRVFFENQQMVQNGSQSPWMLEGHLKKQATNNPPCKTHRGHLNAASNLALAWNCDPFSTKKNADAKGFNEPMEDGFYDLFPSAFWSPKQFANHNFLGPSTLSACSADKSAPAARSRSAFQANRSDETQLANKNDIVFSYTHIVS